MKDWMMVVSIVSPEAKKSRKAKILIETYRAKKKSIKKYYTI